MDCVGHQTVDQGMKGLWHLQPWRYLSLTCAALSKLVLVQAWGGPRGLQRFLPTWIILYLSDSVRIFVCLTKQAKKKQTKTMKKSINTCQGAKKPSPVSRSGKRLAVQPLGNYIMLERRGLSCVRSMEFVERGKLEGMKAGCITGEGILHSRDRRIISVQCFCYTVLSQPFSWESPGPRGIRQQSPFIDFRSKNQTESQYFNDLAGFFLLPHKRFRHGNHLHHSATQTLILSGFPVSSQHQQHSLSVAVLLQQDKFSLGMWILLFIIAQPRINATHILPQAPISVPLASLDRTEK